MSRKRERRFKYGRYGHLKGRALRDCSERGHEMRHVTNWHHRQEGLNEKFFCVRCKMELFIQFHPPAGYGHVHGTAPYITCTNKPDDNTEE